MEYVILKIQKEIVQVKNKITLGKGSPLKTPTPALNLPPKTLNPKTLNPMPKILIPYK